MANNADNITGIEYSKRLGIISPDQFQAALKRFDLGDFLEAAPVTGGLFGQNVFVTSTKGQYVLRGAPHYPWQFPKECFGAKLLHERTCVPVAYPYLLDAAEDIFGWNYILMPRMQGVSPTDKKLTGADNVNIAREIGKTLAEMHDLTWEFAGEYDLTAGTIIPFAEGFSQWIVSDVRRWLESAQKHGARTTDEDADWIEKLIMEAEPALSISFQPCFVMNDTNPGNFLVRRSSDRWNMSGLFDLMEYSFGDGEVDLMRLTAHYLDLGGHQDTALASVFGNAYFEEKPMRPGFAQRHPLYMARERLIVWEYGTRPECRWFDGLPKDISFQKWAERLTSSYRLFSSCV